MAAFWAGVWVGAVFSCWMLGCFLWFLFVLVGCGGGVVVVCGLWLVVFLWVFGFSVLFVSLWVVCVGVVVLGLGFFVLGGGFVFFGVCGVFLYGAFWGCGWVVLVLCFCIMVFLLGCPGCWVGGVVLWWGLLVVCGWWLLRGCLAILLLLFWWEGSVAGRRWWAFWLFGLGHWFGHVIRCLVVEKRCCVVARC
ncbi:hypothetical protein [Neisseria sp. P0016.S006]|uniref:hypothetical protein n=1 Tax=Neisseria sp. P0016.S006 TaxID=3436772 RepID=UPI003F7F73B1